jgi:hypothetical protein
MHHYRSGAGGSRSSLMRWVGWTAVVGLLVAAFVAPGTVTSTDAPGNNGTVKIHEGGTETEPIVRNEPHVCTFHLHFFFADPFQAGTWEIQEWSPGDKGVVVLSGTYDTNGDGEDRDPDEPGVYTLPDGHYKLFWDGDLDTQKHDKHKVFWVDCPETAPPTFEQSVGAETDVPSDSVPPSFQHTVGPETASPPPDETGSLPPGGTASLAPSFGQSVGAETDIPTPSFVQSVAGDTDIPGGPATQPPTDMRVATGPDDEGWRWLFVIIAALLGTLLVTTPKVRPAPMKR